jgi:hydrogenase nickel incorporation protein HypA/HybF
METRLMHELSLAEGIVRILEEQALSRGYTRVNCVWLEIGRLSHVAPEALAFCFDAVTRATLAEGARLELCLVDGRGWCRDCAAEVPVASHGAPCPQCGGYRVEATAGTELRVRELEVE